MRFFKEIYLTHLKERVLFFKDKDIKKRLVKKKR